MPEASTSDPPEFTAVDAYLSVLNHPLRRQVVECLKGTEGGQASVEELVASIDGEPGTQADDERVDVQLHHVHLPKLAQSGVVEFDPRRGLVEYQANADLEYWLGLIRSWQYRTGGTAASSRPAPRR
jgi:hypothetical protein